MWYNYISQMRIVLLVSSLAAIDNATMRAKVLTLGTGDGLKCVRKASSKLASSGCRNDRHKDSEGMGDRVNIFEFSDLHQRPDEPLHPNVTKLFSLANRNTPSMIVANGDIWDIAIYGVEAYMESEPVKEFAQLAWTYNIPTVLILGNHELRLNWLKSLFNSQNITVERNLEITIGYHNWHFEHGDRFSIDWGHLRWLYQFIAESVMRVNPKLWLWFCGKMGWRPGKLKSAYRVGASESQQFTKLTGICWGNTLLWASRNEKDSCIGHTHLAASMLTPYKVIDGGDIRDGSYVLIADNSGEPELHWLK